MIIIFIKTHCLNCEVYRVLNAFEAYRDRFAILWFKSQLLLNVARILTGDESRYLR